MNSILKENNVKRMSKEDVILSKKTLYCSAGINVIYARKILIYACKIKIIE